MKSKKLLTLILMGIMAVLFNSSCARKIIYEETFGTYRFLYSAPNETKELPSLIGMIAKSYVPTSNHPMNIAKVFDTSYEKIWNSILKVVEILEGKVIVKDESSGIIVFAYPEKIKWKYLEKHYLDKDSYQRRGWFFYLYPYKEKYVIKPKGIHKIFASGVMIDSIKFPVYLNIYMKREEINKTKVYVTYFIPFLDVPYDRYIDINFFEFSCFLPTKNHFIKFFFSYCVWFK